MGARRSFLNTSESDGNARIVTIATHTDVCLDPLNGAEERRGVLRLDRWKLHDATGIGKVEHVSVGGIYGKEHGPSRYEIALILLTSP